MLVAGTEGLVIVPVPDTKVHIPVPTIGEFPVTVTVDEQIVWSDPAFAVEGNGRIVICTSSDVEVHAWLVMIHLKV